MDIFLIIIYYLFGLKWVDKWKQEFQFVSGELVACALNRPFKYGTKCQ